MQRRDEDIIEAYYEAMLDGYLDELDDEDDELYDEDDDDCILEVLEKTALNAATSSAAQGMEESGNPSFPHDNT